MFQFLKSFFKSHSAVDGSTSPTNLSTEPSTTIKYNGCAPKNRWDQIEYAFTSGGVNYFQFVADLNIPMERANAALDIYRELEYGINPTILTAHTIAIEKLLMDSKVKPEKKIMEMAILNNRIKERLGLAVSIQLNIKLATVKYFDETENPLGYQFPYNQEKIKHWMKHNDIATFFLMLPQNQFLPSGPEFEKSLKTFMEGESLMMLKELKHLTTLIPSDNLSEDMRKSLYLLTEIQEDMKSWSLGQSTNTI